MCRKFYIAQAAELDLTAVEGTKEVKNSLTQTSVSEAVCQSWQTRLWVSGAKDVIKQLLQQNQLQTAALPFACCCRWELGMEQKSSSPCCANIPDLPLLLSCRQPAPSSTSTTRTGQTTTCPPPSSPSWSSSGTFAATSPMTGSLSASTAGGWAGCQQGRAAGPRAPCSTSQGSQGQAHSQAPLVGSPKAKGDSQHGQGVGKEGAAGQQ